jgi:hypothetical protein
MLVLKELTARPQLAKYASVNDDAPQLRSVNTQDTGRPRRS